MTRSEKRLWGIAYHEAGHAVLALHLDVGLQGVTVVPGPDGGSLGHVVLSKSPRWFKPDVDLSDRARVRIEHEIMVCYAGYHANAQFLGRRPRGWTARPDNHAAIRLSGYVCEGEAETAFLHYCFLRSRDLVKGRWLEIKAIAAALVKQKTLSLEQVRQVIAAEYGIEPLSEMTIKVSR